jgi:hypothetical protein
MLACTTLEIDWNPSSKNSQRLLTLIYGHWLVFAPCKRWAAQKSHGDLEDKTASSRTGELDTTPFLSV